MKHIFLNLKRFDILPEAGGVNRLADPREWGAAVVGGTQDGLDAYSPDEVEFVQYLPEAHLIAATGALKEGSKVRVGCQSVIGQDTAPGGNFGAFTSSRTANSMVQLGVNDALIGHCEERNDKAATLAEAGISDPAAVNRLLNKEVLTAQAAGMRVLYCIGEKEEELDSWDEVLLQQLQIGLEGADLSRVVIAYEPVWSIGPGKTPADKDYITKVAQFIKANFADLDIVYGGGLKQDNAEMLASIPEISGGLIALTRFTGEIGFYPEDYLEIIRLYLGH